MIQKLEVVAKGVHKKTLSNLKIKESRSVYVNSTAETILNEIMEKGIMCVKKRVNN